MTQKIIHSLFVRLFNASMAFKTAREIRISVTVYSYKWSKSVIVRLHNAIVKCSQIGFLAFSLSNFQQLHAQLFHI